MRVVVQYSVGVPVDYLFRNAGRGAERRRGGGGGAGAADRARNVDAVLTTEKAAHPG